MNQDVTPQEVQGTETLSGIHVKDALLAKRRELAMKLGEIEEAVAELNEEYGQKLQEFQARKKPLEEALYHVEALLRLDGCGEDSSGTHTHDTLSARSIPDGSITDVAFGVLEESGVPMHYRELAEKLLERSIYIPGRDSAATLLSRMSRDKRFKRGGKRGVYALSTWRLGRKKTKSSRVARRNSRKQ